MMPMLPFSPPPSVANAYARVDKATSEFLSCPDWRINIGVCDTINSKPWLAKDYIKAVRGRLQHKNPNVQLLSLTLLETIVKNCSENVHGQIAERKMLHEMIKIVKKKSHMRVREKILALIDNWREAFGGRGRMTAQYHRAYEELRRYGVEFPRRSPNSVPLITPPVNHGHGASSSSRHEPSDNVSLVTLESMRNVLDVLSEMLQAIDPKDRKAVKNEVIVDLYGQCRSNQKKLGQTLSSTTDEEILGQGIQFNEALQYIIEKHDAIASGSPLPLQPLSFLTHQTRLKHFDGKEVSPKASSVPSAPIIPTSSNEIEEEENTSSHTASRGKETQTVVTQTGKNTSSDTSLSMALVPSDPPLPTDKKTAEEDMIDLLSLALSPATPSTLSPINQTDIDSTIADDQPQIPLSSYVVPWAQTQALPEYEQQPQAQNIQQQANYIPPPWAPTPGYYCNPYASNYSASSYYDTGSTSGADLNPYVPSYRLFDDLNVLGNFRASGTPGTSGPSMLGARK
ncbi:TOM1-like protein 6 [Tanacetum coccineum]|uniref:TOM1-like protein 6 n=2 Tax=Tanacetum TaxID=99105 RepID=A0ABQ5C865_9ASTR